MPLLAYYSFGVRVFSEHKDNEKGYQNPGEPKRHRERAVRTGTRGAGAHIPHRLLPGSPPALESSRLCRGLSSHTPFHSKPTLPTSGPGCDIFRRNGNVEKSRPDDPIRGGSSWSRSRQQSRAGHSGGTRPPAVAATTEPGGGGRRELPRQRPLGRRNPPAEPRGTRTQPGPSATSSAAAQGRPRGAPEFPWPPGRCPSAGPPLHPPAESGTKLCGAEQCGEDYLSFRRPGEGSGGRGGGSGAAPRRRSRGGAGRLSPPRARLRNPREPSPVPSRPGRGQAGCDCGTLRRRGPLREPRLEQRRVLPCSVPSRPVPAALRLPACLPLRGWRGSSTRSARPGGSLISRIPCAAPSPALRASCGSCTPARGLRTSAAQLVAMCAWNISHLSLAPETNLNTTAEERESPRSTRPSCLSIRKHFMNSLWSCTDCPLTAFTKSALQHIWY
ncbi:uncharacterized protein FYW23_008503 [Sylvia borin]